MFHRPRVRIGFIVIHQSLFFAPEIFFFFHAYVWRVVVERSLFCVTCQLLHVAAFTLLLGVSSCPADFVRLLGIRDPSYEQVFSFFLSVIF